MNWLSKLCVLGLLVCLLSAGPAQAAPYNTDPYAPSVGYASYYYVPGGITASGDELTYDDWTMASRDLAFGTQVTVCYVTCAYNVTVTDWGPAEWTGRNIDLNMIVAEEIGLAPTVGVDYVTYEVTGYDPYYLYNN
jgi:rare lipoprotein A (peptidoglycan hydrolase)